MGCFLVVEVHSRSEAVEVVTGRNWPGSTMFVGANKRAALFKLLMVQHVLRSTGTFLGKPAERVLSVSMHVKRVRLKWGAIKNMDGFLSTTIH